MALVVTGCMDVKGRICVWNEMVNLDVVVDVALLMAVNGNRLDEIAARCCENSSYVTFASETSDGK
jgi:hypothetical protein